MWVLLTVFLTRLYGLLRNEVLCRKFYATAGENGWPCIDWSESVRTTYDWLYGLATNRWQSEKQRIYRMKCQRETDWDPALHDEFVIHDDS